MCYQYVLIDRDKGPFAYSVDEETTDEEFEDEESEDENVKEII